MSHIVTYHMLTWIEFEIACKKIIVNDWSWNEHPLGLGFLSRTVLHHYHRSQSSPPTDTDVELQDDAEASANPETLVTQQYVVYSQTFRVPTFYFSVYDSTGSPLTLADLVRTTLFRPFAFENTELSTFGITRPDSSFPILSQGEHPTLGTPCWYLHPCATDAAVTDLMAETEMNDERVVRWLEIWFMVISTALNIS